MLNLLGRNIVRHIMTLCDDLIDVIHLSQCSSGFYDIFRSAPEFEKICWYIERKKWLELGKITIEYGYLRTLRLMWDREIIVHDGTYWDEELGCQHVNGAWGNLFQHALSCGGPTMLICYTLYQFISKPISNVRARIFCACAASGGKREVIEWLKDTEKLQVNWQSIFKNACRSNHPEIMIWAKNNGGYHFTSDYLWECGHGSLERVKSLMISDKLDPRPKTNIKIRSKRTGKSMTYTTIGAIHGIFRAITNQRRDVYELLLEHYATPDHYLQIMLSMISVDNLAWLQEFVSTHQIEPTNPQLLAVAATRTTYSHCLKWLLETFPTLRLKTIRSLSKYFVPQCNMRTLEEYHS